MHKHADGDTCHHDHSSHSHGKKKPRKLKPNAYEYDPMEKKRKKELKKAQKLAKLEGAGQLDGQAVRDSSPSVAEQGNGQGGLNH